MDADIAGDTFHQQVREYIVTGFEKGIPSLFVDVKGLYTDAGKMAVVGEVVEEIVQDLESDKLHDDGKPHFCTGFRELALTNRYDPSTNDTTLGLLFPRSTSRSSEQRKSLSLSGTGATTESTRSYTDSTRDLHGASKGTQACR